MHGDGPALGIAGSAMRRAQARSATVQRGPRCGRGCARGTAPRGRIDLPRRSWPFLWDRLMTRICIVGAGAVGGYLGARLAQAGEAGCQRAGARRHAASAADRRPVPDRRWRHAHAARPCNGYCRSAWRAGPRDRCGQGAGPGERGRRHRAADRPRHLRGGGDEWSAVVVFRARRSAAGPALAGRRPARLHCAGDPDPARTGLRGAPDVLHRIARPCPAR